MYSYEDRIRAVTLYIQLGKRVAATIQQLGYPTKNSLKGWYREYDQERDLKNAVVRPSKFTIEQRTRAVEHYLTHGRCVAFTIKALGYPGRASLHAWVQELNPRARPRVLGASSNEQKHAAVLACAQVKEVLKLSLTTLACVERRCTTGAMNYWGQRLSHR